MKYEPKVSEKKKIQRHTLFIVTLINFTSTNDFYSFRY